MSNTTIQLNEELYDYLLSVSLKEDEVLTSLRKTTSFMPGSRMQIAPDQGQFMAMLIKIMGAERLIEIGNEMQKMKDELNDLIDRDSKAFYLIMV